MLIDLFGNRAKNRDRIQGNALVPKSELCGCGSYAEGTCPTCNPLIQREIDNEKAKQNKPSLPNFKDSLGETFDLG